DRDKVVMALHNLVGNAVKYTPAGGQVLVRASADAQTLTIDVADNGIGIKEDEQPLVFEKFYRAKDRRIAGVTGTGLGLAIAREVVRLHGGDITLSSAIDKGSTFTMTLPAKAA
ncbi:MAG: ATP-binding protein, partial [Phycisphaerales bacterium]|nr:ATP-binding protein [Phycisphaerales bacterium]